MKQLFHDVGGQILQRAADQHGQQKDRSRIGGEAGQKHRDKHRAEAVDGAVGADEKAPVDKAMELEQLAGDFHQPAQHGAEEKQQKIPAYQIERHKGPPLVHSSGKHFL